MLGAIASPDNDKVRYVRSLREHNARQRARHFLVEGVRLVSEALDAGSTPSLVLVDEQAIRRTERGRELLRRLESVGYYAVAERALKAAAETVTPQGVVAAVPLPDFGNERVGPMALILDRVQDPGNLGTILRSAEATGTRPLYLAPGTVDAFSPKVVRAGMGAHFRVPLRPSSWEEIASDVAGRQVWVAEPRGGVPYDRIDWTTPGVLIVGGEAEGPSERAHQLATGRLTIPMVGSTESLNAAVAASVIMFESLRQRRAAGQTG